ncbi:MAG: hypothetical protein IKH77_03115 [Clostridia bacterium]|nr:hypothetical protein [Clostridia bacterium]
MKRIVSLILALVLALLAGLAAADDTASEAPDSLVYGEWQEKDTQFTTLDIRDADDGWKVVITSPMTHGAYRITCTARYDAALNALVYTDGTRFDMDSEGGFIVPPAAEHLEGSLVPGGSEEAPLLAWHNGGEDAEVTWFERAPGLPAYACTGEDPVEAALVSWMVEQGQAGMYLRKPGDTWIPTVIVLKTADVDETHRKVWACLWDDIYVRQEDTLLCIAGGLTPCAATLVREGDGWQVVSLAVPEEGDAYSSSLQALAENDEALLAAFGDASDARSAITQEARCRFIRGYVQANGLSIAAYRDYGWDPVFLAE